MLVWYWSELPFVLYCIVLYCVLYSLLNFEKKKKKKKIKKKPRSLRYIDTAFRWADSRGIRYNRFYVIANYVISVVTCIHFKWSSAGPRRGLRNNRELRYIGLRYIDSWLYCHPGALPDPVNPGITTTSNPQLGMAMHSQTCSLHSLLHFQQPQCGAHPHFVN